MHRQAKPKEILTMQSTLRRLMATALLCLPVAAFAQYPDAPIRLDVGFPPGTGPDIVARTLSQQLGQRLRQSVVVENRAGAGGQIAAQAVARSPAAGYTLLLGEVRSNSLSRSAAPPGGKEGGWTC